MSTFTRFPLLCNTFRLQVEIKMVSWLNSAPVKETFHHFLIKMHWGLLLSYIIVNMRILATLINSALNYPPRWHINIRVEIGVCFVPSKPPIAPSIAIGNSS